MSAIMYLLIAGILACVLAMIIVAARSTDSGVLPPVESRILLNKKEIAMYRDLGTISAKLHLVALAKVPLSHLVHAQEEAKRPKLKPRLLPILIPFVLGDDKTAQALMAVLPAEFNDDYALSVLDAAKIPYLQLNNYNVPGLEKAIREKLAGSGALPPAKPEPKVAPAPGGEPAAE